MSIIVNNLVYLYNEGMPYETRALDNISFSIEQGDFVGIIGHTGSGKSTLIQHLNGLLKCKSGEIIINGIDITKKEIKKTKIRQKVGLVFQYPEYQIFEETVYKDVAFGPINLGLEEQEVQTRVKEAIELVGLNYGDIKERSPFELSGGQKRRVAIAGVIAMKPEVLILDEPTAGLDPKGREEILGQIQKLHKDNNITIILVSHNMGDVARLANNVIVMNKGKIVLKGKPNEVFKNVDLLESIGLGVPPVMTLMDMLKKKGKNVRDDILTIEEAKEELIKLLRRNESC